MKCFKLYKSIKNDDVKNVLVVGNVYTLYIYIHLFGDLYKNTLLISSTAIPKEFADKFACHYILDELSNGIVKKIITYLRYRIKTLPINLLLRLQAKRLKFYGNDHLFYSNLLTISSYELLEDGLLNYVYTNKKMPRVYKIFIRNPFGENINCKRIYLTGLKDIPGKIKTKTEIINLNDKKNINALLDVFELQCFDDNCKNNVLLITQPFSEDNICTEAEKIELYKKLLEHVDLNNSTLIIKPHPREKTEYSDYFEDVKVLDSKLPLEIMSLNNIQFEMAITYFSTAVYNVRAANKIFLGTNKIDFLEARFGHIAKQV